MPAAPSFDVTKLRNIGIIAHIDAGKTTTTERILYYTGTSHKLGEVDEGTTTTDFDTDEQNRGITIKSAAVTCKWKDVTVNIIDTPGHVDFTAEVERSLRVLDGGVVVFSAMEGVEAQSETVWHQADHYGVPRICYVNKLDRIGADFFRVLGEMTERLGCKPIVLTLPIGQQKDFAGIVDLIHRRAIHFDAQSQGKEMTESDVPADMADEVEEWRERIFDAVAEIDDELAERYLAEGDVPPERLKAAIRTACIAHGYHPVLCGSSLKYIGVQPVLDAVRDYLPCPTDLPPVPGHDPKTDADIQVARTSGGELVVLLFKIVAGKHEELGFVRVYRGDLKPSSRLLNARTGKKENITRLWRVHADSHTKLDVAHAGDIVGVVGFKNSVTGDTLCDPKAPVLLEKITFPETVISMAVEPESSADKDKLADVLEMLQKEDPTFRYQISSETGETLVSGMGELHLEIQAGRIARDFGVRIRSGKPRVSYRETIRSAVRVTGQCHRQTASGDLFASVDVSIAPLGDAAAGDDGETCFEFVDAMPKGAEDAPPPQFLPIVRDALEQECLAGGVTGFPLTGLKATLHGYAYRPEETTEEAYRIAVSHALNEALEKGGVLVLEPIMKVEVVTPEEYLGDVNADLSQRRAEIQDVGVRGERRVVVAHVPLREMFGYTTRLRSASQGRANYSMEPLRYAAAPASLAEQLT